MNFVPFPSVISLSEIVINGLTVITQCHKLHSFHESDMYGERERASERMSKKKPLNSHRELFNCHKRFRISFAFEFFSCMSVVACFVKSGKTEARRKLNTKANCFTNTSLCSVRDMRRYEAHENKHEQPSFCWKLREMFVTNNHRKIAVYLEKHACIS